MPRVDQPDVDLDEDDVPAAEEEAPEEAMDTNEQQETAKKQFKLSYEKYKKISFLIIEHIRWALGINFNVLFLWVFAPQIFDNRLHSYWLLSQSLFTRRKEAETESSGRERQRAQQESGLSCNVAPLIREHLLSMILQVIAWYLDEIGNDIETEDELIEQKQVIEKVRSSFTKTR